MQDAEANERNYAIRIEVWVVPLNYAFNHNSYYVSGNHNELVIVRLSGDFLVVTFIFVNTDYVVWFHVKPFREVCSKVYLLVDVVVDFVLFSVSFSLINNDFIKNFKTLIVILLPLL